MTEQPQMTTGSIIDRLYEIRSERKILSDQDKELKHEFDELEQVLITRLKADDSLQGKTKTATATITETVVPTIKDWDAFERYVLENNALYLLQRRPASAAFRELLNMGETVPGLEPFTSLSISLRRN